MSFSIAPKGSSGPIVESPQASASAQAAKERAIALVSGVNAPPTNQNAVDLGDKAAQGQANTTETPPAEANQPPAKVETPAPDKQLSTQYAQLARQEKALRARFQETKAKEADLAKREAALTASQAAKDAEYQSKYISKDRLAQDTLNALSEAGLTYDQITELMVKAPQTAENQAISQELKTLKAELAAIKGEQEKSTKNWNDQQTQSYQQALHQIKLDAVDLVTKAPEEYEAIKATNSVDDVVDLIEKTFKKDKILLTVEQAAKEVEDYLVEEAMKITRINKIQQKLKQAAPAPKNTENGKNAQQQQQSITMKTLTNAVTSTRPVSARERAIAAAQGRLKQE